MLLRSKTCRSSGLSCSDTNDFKTDRMTILCDSQSYAHMESEVLSPVFNL